MKDQERMNEQRMMSRRELLGSAAAVAAFTIVPSHVLGAAGRGCGKAEFRLRRRTHRNDHVQLPRRRKHRRGDAASDPQVRDQRSRADERTRG